MERFETVTVLGVEAVCEIGTTRYWSPGNPHGFQVEHDDGQTEFIPLTSHGEFGDDYYWSVRFSETWCREAEAAWYRLNLASPATSDQVEDLRRDIDFLARMLCVTLPSRRAR